MPQFPPSPCGPGLLGVCLSKVSAEQQRGCEDVDISMTEMLTQGTIPSCKFHKSCPIGAGNQGGDSRGMGGVGPKVM